MIKEVFKEEIQDQAVRKEHGVTQEIEGSKAELKR